MPTKLIGVLGLCLVLPFFSCQSKKNNLFRKVVLAQYPYPGIYSMGFLTGDSPEEARIKTEKKLFNVFIPTTPNPTSGMLVMLPEKDLVILKVSIEDDMKLIISAGALGPEKNGATASR